MTEEDKIKLEEYSKMVNSNTILLSLEGWIKFIEGFTKGLQTTEKISSSAVLDCVGEILEYINSFKPQLINLFTTCEAILQENEILKTKLKDLTESYLIENKIEQAKGEQENEEL